jgi:Fe-S-cluster-containing dehydrogenase component
MARYGIAIDTDQCMACYNCVIACKDEHCGFSTAVSAPQPHIGQKWIRIDSSERGNDSRRIKTLNVAVTCTHCHDAPCQKAAENGAVYTRPDGIVIIDPEKAKGQKQLVDSCPVNAIYWNDDLELPQKCTMCAHLLDEGYKMPRCVEACPNEAMVFGDLDDPDSEINRFIRQGRVTPLEGLAEIETNVIYMNIPTIFAAGSVYLPDGEPADGASIRIVSMKTGEALTTRTNYFGDWEFEGLEKGADYTVEIRFSGNKEETIRFAADADKFVGEVILRELN